MSIPNSVSIIDEWSFASCNSLLKIDLPNSIRQIKYAAFAYCTGLTEVIIPNSVTEIGQYAFEKCTGLKSITVGDSVTYIASYAFSGCTSLISATIGKSVTGIHAHAFNECPVLTKLYWNARDCSDHLNIPTLSEVIIGSEVLKIPKRFVEGTSISSIIIPNSVYFIGEYAFYNCRNLRNLTIGTSVSIIEFGAFRSDPLTKLTWNARSCTSTGGDFPKSDITQVIIGDEVSTLPASFVQDSKISSVTIPASVTSIGNNAFYGCSGLTQLSWNAKNCSTMGNMPTSNITKVSIGSSVQVIPENFVSGSKITSIEIPGSVTSIGNNAFYNCLGVNSIVVNSANSIYDSRGNCNALIESKTNILITGCKNTTIPESITAIKDNAFYNCSGLTSITVPVSVTSIGSYAFSGCTGLNQLTWNAENCSTMGNMPKSNITQISIGNTVRTIPSDFVKGSKISSITIPVSLTSIGSNAFSDCSMECQELLNNGQHVNIEYYKSKYWFKCSGYSCKFCQQLKNHIH